MAPILGAALLCIAVVLTAARLHAAPATQPDKPDTGGSTPRAGSSLLTTPTTLPASKRFVSKVPPPTTAIPPASCVTADCHANIKDYKVLHGPVNVNACDACHKLTNASKHTFEMAHNKTETCTFCHQIDTHGDPVVHKPVTEGQCLACHDPHGGATKKFTRGNSTRELCDSCHKDPVGDNKHVHGPVAAGACESCHTGHSSKNPKLLVATGRDLCLTCHAEMKTQLAKVKFTHKAVTEGDCEKCHDPHASPYVMQIRQDPKTLCTSCHEHDAIKKAIDSATYKHSAVQDAGSCLNCHNAHGGNLDKLMKAQSGKLCLACHDKKIEVRTADNALVRTVPSMAFVTNPKLSKHGPVADGNCNGCHSPHGGEVSRLLAKPYPATFYQPFKAENYELCFTCHDQQLVTQEKTTGLTNFRNGDTNLHFLHVNKEDKGRSCRACHETHASVQPMHIRDSVPFGKWEMPVKFTPTPNGGSCLAGCHKELTYDRKQPVTYETNNAGTIVVAPSTRPGN